MTSIIKEVKLDVQLGNITDEQAKIKRSYSISLRGKGSRSDSQ
ncbi:hypothetical protein AB1K84_23580 [Mesobacillus foraminis]